MDKIVKTENLVILAFGILVLSLIMAITSLASSKLEGLIIGRRPPQDFTEQQVSDGIELPRWGIADESYRGNMDIRLWPEDAIRFVELRMVEQALQDDEFETPEDRIRYIEAYDVMLCVAASDGFQMPPPTEEAEPAVDFSMLIHVELKKKRITLKDGDEIIKVFSGIEYSRVGIGGGYNSKRTPVGEFTITKEPKHRYGPVLRLSGYQGWTRGILIHQDNTRDSGSNGCIHLRNLKDMRELFASVPSGARLLIEH